MKKILGLVLVLICLVTPAFAEPISQEILDQARAQAGLFMDLKNALGLDWLDKYNAYLANPVSSPKPTWTTSVTTLINKKYLSSSFPTDFQITPTGQEVTIKRTITNQGVKNALPIYLPSVAISGDTVSLLVQRPAQWVAWEAGLLGKVSRDGSDNPDILPNSVLDFGKSSEIKFVNNDGKITGVNSLIYKTQELDSRFVNVSGDNMTGDLTIKGNKAWHAGNDGTGSGLDADLLDGKDSAFFTNASNMNAGTLPAARLSGTYGINISGNAATATNAANANYASSAGNADTVDSKHASDFALSGHTHGQYVQKTGDTMTGNLTAPQFRGNIYIPDTRNDTINPGDLFQESRIDFKFANILEIPLPKGVYYTTITMRPWRDDTGGPAHQIALGNGDDIRYRTGTRGSGWSSWNKIWHSGNDGSGSGLDADLLDGKDSTYFTNASNLASGVVPAARLSGTYGISITGNAATATKLAMARTISLTGNASGSASFDGSGNVSINTTVSQAANADKLGGYAHTDFVKKAGDTMTGPLGVNFESGITSGIGSHNIKGTGSTDVVGKGFKINWDTDFGFVGLVDKGADRKDMVFANEQTGDNFVFMSQGMEIMALKPASKTLEIGGNKVWHAGNDGSGSGMDADKVDGKDKVVGYGNVIPAGANLNSYTEPGMYYCPANVDAKTIANRPTDNAFSLLVEQHAGVKQTLTEYITSNAKTYVRNYYSGTWGAWTELGGSAIVAQSLGTNGYVKFDNGFMIQWGHRTESLNNRCVRTINFPIPFPNKALWCNSILDTHHPSAERPNCSCSLVDRYSLKVGKGDVIGGWYWIALGY